MSNILHKILIVDDELGIRESLSAVLEDEYSVITAESGEEALNRLEGMSFSLALLDIAMPGIGGEQLLSMIKASWPNTEVIMVTGVKDVDQAVRCMKLGAYDFLSKPWNVAELKAIIRRALEKWELSKENRLFRDQNREQNRKLDDIIGDSPVMQRVRERLSKIAAHDSQVLIHGESGTGKELVARAIHALSPRSKESFVAISCAAIPENLVESELFGHEKGAFSSAVRERIGKFEYASGGTLFLDDVATLPRPVQAKLLRVLQEREITRVGGNRVIPVDVRVLSSTNQDLRDMVRSGQFREDLYWRLCGVPFHVPALRERGEDVLQLFEYFVAKRAHEYNRTPPVMSPGVRQVLLNHSFPGNVRELANLAETVVVLCEEKEIPVSALPIQLLMKRAKGKDGEAAEGVPMKQAVQEFERHLIVRTLNSVNWNQSKAARELGVHRNTLIFKMKEMGITRTS